MKKVCFVTSARSEYGLMRWIIDEVYKDSDLQLLLIVTGGHLSIEQGLTYRQIEKDGYPIDAKIETLLASDTETAICKSMGLCLMSISEELKRLKPDILIVLGDRYELLPICSAALLHNIPIAHISGGDVTEGAVDNKVRNAITQMATYHFPGTEESAERIRKMTGSAENVYVTGETNLDNFRLMKRLTREELALSLNINPNKEWILCTYHSETLLSIEENMNRVNTLLRLFSEDLKDFEIIITKSNADYGGMQINAAMEVFCQEHRNVHIFSSLGIMRYISVLYQVRMMIGNSSSGIFESPVVGVPVVNIGNRQEGRIITSNIILSSGCYEDLQQTSMQLLGNTVLPHVPVENPYGDGHASERIYHYLKHIVYGL